MKHLQKKFIRSFNIAENVIEHLDSVSISDIENPKLELVKENEYTSFILSDQNEFIQAFHYKYENKDYFIPEPNPIVIYFDTGRFYSMKATQMKPDLLKALSDKKADIGHNMNFFYAYISNCSGAIIFLFNALEAFVNKIIPNDFEYRKESNRRTEIYNKMQIQRALPIEEKIKYVIPKFTNKSFHLDYPELYKQLEKFKLFRDEIVHTKSMEQMEGSNFYRSLFITALDFDYSVTLYSVRDYINFYEPNLIEECDCGRE